MIQGAQCGNLCSQNKISVLFISSVSSLGKECTVASSPVIQFQESDAFLARSLLWANKEHYFLNEASLLALLGAEETLAMHTRDTQRRL